MILKQEELLVTCTLQVLDAELCFESVTSFIWRNSTTFEEINFKIISDFPALDFTQGASDSRGGNHKIHSLDHLDSERETLD